MSCSPFDCEFNSVFGNEGKPVLPGLRGTRFEVLACLLSTSGRGLTWLSAHRRHTLYDVLRRDDELVTQARVGQLPAARASL
ncbi:MAG: hypothetical protein JOZ18_13710 [Chloroflexi bacterium]|nr:hypothetical protein [Chloroflexota bacterium]